MIFRKIKSFFISSWLIFAFGFYFLLWFFRFLEPWQKDLPVASAKESLKFLGTQIGLWPIR